MSISHYKVRQSSGSHGVVFGQSWGSRGAVVGQSWGSRGAVVGQSWSRRWYTCALHIVQWALSVLHNASTQFCYQDFKPALQMFSP